jgi:hypothetical protein
MTKQTGNHLLITGCYRSGTTIVEKIINMHPKATVASQPFPILFFIFKEKFNTIRDIERRYPLDHLFLEDAYTNQDFKQFLLDYSVDKRALIEFKRRMSDYSEGLWTPEIIDLLDQLQPGTFFEIYHGLLDLIAAIYTADKENLIGTKEVLVEEYTPAMIELGVKVIFVVRDPRDMITSLNFRVRDNLTGENRPILYSLRAWRKSIAFAFAAAQRNEGCIVRYEDLVTQQSATISKLTRYLGIDEFKTGAFDNGIVDQKGVPWKGNSSFTDQKGISGKSLHTYKKYLSQDVNTFIETFCGPEMQLLGYMPGSSIETIDELTRTYRDPFESSHEKFEEGYSHNRERLQREKERLEKLRHGGNDRETQRKWFITPEIYSAMSAMYTDPE